MTEPHRPEYLRVANDLRDRIRTGVLKPGEKLPTRLELAGQYGVGKTTIDSAMIILRTDGLVRGIQGGAVYIADPLPPGII
jgi:GntR family transcriptional regulator